MQDGAVTHFIGNVVHPLQFRPVTNETGAVDSRRGELLQNPRDVFRRAALAAFGTGKDAAEVERQCMNADALVVRQDTEEHTTPATEFGDVVSRFDDFWISCAVDGDISQTAKNFFHAFSCVFARGIDLVSHAVFSGLGQFVIMQVDADDRIGPGQFGPKHRTQPDAPYPEDDDGLARFNFCVIVDDAEAGGECVSQETAKFEVGVGRNLGQAVFGYDRVFLEGRDRARIHFGAAPIVDRAAGIDPRPRTPMANDAVTRCDMRHVRANFKNDSPSFMSEKMRKKFIRTLDPIDLTNLRSANARGVDFDQHLPALERRNFNLVDDQRLALLD